MIIYPAIDLKDGACVRLLRGEMSQATVFNTEPADQARLFESQGFEWLHLVDLNGAFEGKPVNGQAVESILGAVTIPVQLGGGIRDLKTIAHWLEKGVSRVILAPSPCVSRSWSVRPAGSSPARSPSASTRARVTWPSPAGPRPRPSRRWI